MWQKVVEWVNAAALCLAAAGVIFCLTLAVLAEGEGWDDDAGKGE